MKTARSQGAHVATAGHGPRFRRTVALGLAVLSTLALAAPALAKSGGNSGGNSAAAAACADMGYQDWTDVAGDTFRNEGGCVSYAAHGGTLMPVERSPFSISYTASGASGFEATLIGTGLEPESSVDLFVTWGDNTLFVGDVTNPDGDIVLVASFICVSFGSPVTDVSAGGTPAAGLHTDYMLPSPDASICSPQT